MNSTHEELKKAHASLVNAQASTIKHRKELLSKVSKEDRELVLSFERQYRSLMKRGEKVAANKLKNDYINKLTK